MSLAQSHTAIKSKKGFRRLQSYVLVSAVLLQLKVTSFLGFLSEVPHAHLSHMPCVPKGKENSHKVFYF